MKPAFIAFAVCDTFLIIITAIVGVYVQGDLYFRQHFALGLMTTFFTCLCHCVVLTYFMATGKMIRLAIEDAPLDQNLAIGARQSQRLKLRAYAVLMPAIVFALLAAFSGAWSTVETKRAMLHMIVGIVSSAVQFWAFFKEYTLIDENRRVMNATFERHHKVKPGGTSPAC